MLNDDKPWFRRRRYGYGAGAPIAWQGWALLASYIVALTGLSLFAPQARGIELSLVVIAMLVLTGILIAVAKNRTEGEWRWRWGEDD